MNKDNHIIAGAGGGCFRKGSLVQLEGGATISIESLKPGDSVLSFDEQGRLHRGQVSEVHIHEDPQPILHVKYWRGDLFITPNHWVLNQFDAFAEIGMMSEEDALVDGMGHLRPIISKEIIAHEPVYNLTVEPHHTFICNGIRVHNGGHRDRFPVVAGAGGGKKKGGGGSRAAVEAPDSLESKAMINVLDLLGEGEIGGLVDGGKSIYLDNTPLINPDGTQNFNEFVWEERTGTQQQEPMGGYSEIETPYTASVQIKTETPRTITINNENADKVRLVMAVPSLMSQDKKTGDISGTSVSFRFMISTDGGAFTVLGSGKIEGKTRSRFQRSFVYSLPKPGRTWSIRIERTTANSDSAALNNDLFLDNYSEIIESKLAYPNSALIGVRIDSRQFSNIPNRAYLVDGLYIRVPANYTPARKVNGIWYEASYDGVWDGSFRLAVTSNPAWVMYDLLTNKRYGLGEYISPEQVDSAMLYRIGRYCDELVPDGFDGYEPRFTVNTVIQSRAEAYRVISDLASAFRGMAFWAGGLTGFMHDAPRDASMIYTPANVIDGLFTYAGSARKDRYSVALVTWNDPEDNYRPKIEYVEDAELVSQYGIRQTELIAFGCTTRGQAYRAGLSILYTGRYESDLITFSVGLDSALVLPGDIIQIHDTTRAGKRMGGRIASATLREIMLDSPVTLTDSGAKLSMRLPDNTFVTRTVREGPGEHSTLSWIQSLAEAPLPNSLWILSEEALEAMLARVVSIKQESPGEYIITALEHNPSKYDAIEKGLKLETPNTSIVNADEVAEPSNFTAFETTYLVAPRIIGSKILLSWSGNAVAYEVRWRKSGDETGNWVVINTLSPSCEIENVQQARYEFELRSVSLSGKVSRAVYLAHTVTGKTAAPGEVTNFTVSKRISDLLLSWDPVTDIDLLGYEVREGASWDTSRILQSQFMGTSCVDDKNDAGTYHYHIRSINSVGQYSDNTTTYTLELNRPTTVQGFSCVQYDNRIDFRWNANPENDIVGYEIREGLTWALGTLVTEIQATSYSMSAGALAAERTFWIKAIASPGIESAVASFARLLSSAPTDRNVIVEIDEGAGDWPGFRYRVETLGNDLVLENEERYGEYLFNIELPTTYTARNFLQCDFDALAVDGQTWADADYSWSSINAGRLWAYSADTGNISFDFLFARNVGLTDEIVESFPLNGSPDGERGTRAGKNQNVDYRPARFRNGALISNESDLRWPVYFPDEFNLSFWMIPQQTQGNRIIWTGYVSMSESLVLGMDEASKTIFLEDHTGARLSVPVWPNDELDPIFIAFSQTHARRMLHAGLLNQPARTASANYTPVGNIIMMALNPIEPYNYHLGNIFYDGQYLYGSKQWHELDHYTISFDSNGGSTVASLKVIEGDSFDLPPAPTKEGCRFLSWLNQATAENHQPGETVIPTADMQFLAEWEDLPKYSISFDSNGGSAVESMTVTEGEKFSLPAAPVKTGCRFMGWVNKATEEKHLPGAIFECRADMQFMADWEDLPSHTIRFDTGDGLPIQPIQVLDGSSFILPRSADREGYRLKQWINQANDEANEPGATLVADADRTFIAEWAEDDRFTLTTAASEKTRFVISGLNRSTASADFLLENITTGELLEHADLPDTGDLSVAIQAGTANRLKISSAEADICFPANNQAQVLQVSSSLPKRKTVHSKADVETGLFAGQSELTGVSPALFANNTAHFTSLAYGFYGCSQLQNLPEISALAAVTDISHCFFGCTSLRAIPDTYLDSQSELIDCTAAFSGCTGITSALPALWEQFPEANGSACFTGCINAVNWLEVPVNWGGPYTITYKAGAGNGSDVCLERAGSAFKTASAMTFSEWKAPEEGMILAGFARRENDSSVQLGFNEMITLAEEKAVLYAVWLTVAPLTVITDAQSGRSFKINRLNQATASQDLKVVNTTTGTTLTFSDLSTSSLGDLTVPVTAQIQNVITISATAADVLFNSTSRSIETLSGRLPHRASVYNNSSWTNTLFRNQKTLTAVADYIFEQNASMFTSLAYAFDGCAALEQVPDISELANVTNIDYMHNGNSALKTVPEDYFRGQKNRITSCERTFYNCSGITSPIPPLWKQGVDLESGFVAIGSDTGCSTDGMHWHHSSLSGIWNTVAYGDRLWVAAGTSGVSYSSDGINWTTVKLTGSYNSCAYGNGRWIAVSSSYIALSEDGINWTENRSCSGNTVVYGNGRWVIFDSRNSHYSDDHGESWTQFTKPDGSYNHIAYHDGRFVAVGSKIATSSDGINWTVADSGKTLKCVAYGDGQWMAVGNNGAVSHSQDGVNWLHTTFDSKDWNSVAYGNGCFVAIANRYAAFSYDGIGWHGETLDKNWKWLAAGVVSADIPPTSTSYYAYGCVNAANWLEVPVTYGGPWVQTFHPGAGASGQPDVQWVQSSGTKPSSHAFAVPDRAYFESLGWTNGNLVLVGFSRTDGGEIEFVCGSEENPVKAVEQKLHLYGVWEAP